ncbi:MAG: hypothetical protein RBR35_11355 [Salinivirgaceae bacterium]|jgi:hypothetical protein|nr:hypothetical protein [Salinivirgaceae bacterium]
MSKKNAVSICLCFVLIATYAPYSSASMFDDIISGDIEHVLDKRKIRKWNQENRKKYKMSGDERMGCGGYTIGGEQIYGKNFGGTQMDCVFKAEFTNNTTEYITHIVVNFKILNKATNTLVVQEKETIEVSAMPTVTQKLQVYFNNHLFKEAYKQLGESYSWNYELVGCVPKDLAYFTYPPDYNWLE